jgi:LPXTG-motif cell wall-anchored protein
MMTVTLVTVIGASALAAGAQIQDPYSGTGPSAPIVSPSTSARIQTPTTSSGRSVPFPRTLFLPPGLFVDTQRDAQPSARAGQSLPVTGSDVLGLLVLSASLLGVGAALVVLARRRN